MGDKMANIKESRAWLLTFNNPEEHAISLDILQEILENPKSAKTRYWCMSEEIGLNEHTPHIHLYVHFQNPVAFTTIKNKFPSAHIDAPMGTPEQNRDYVFKIGKWENDPKGETNIRDSHRESGACPVFRPGTRNDLTGLYDMIREGKSNFEILETDPQYIKQIDRIDKVRKIIVEERFKNIWRDLEVTYIWGTTGSGKTRSVKDRYGYANVYTITDYAHPWDGYNGQDVILFEEFRSNLRIADMLQFLDGYPLELPCRYNNKVACFTKVFFSTNIDLRWQYSNIQRDEPETWRAFLRRIHKVQVFEDINKTYIMPTMEYLNNMFHFFNNPFEDEIYG